MVVMVVMVVMYHFIAKKIVAFEVCYFAYVPYRKSKFLVNYGQCRQARELNIM